MSMLAEAKKLLLATCYEAAMAVVHNHGGNTDDVPHDEVERMIEEGEITIEEMVQAFHRGIQER